MSAPQRKPSMAFAKRGMGYLADIPEEGVSIALDRIHHSGGETRGELTVTRAEVVGSEHLPAHERGHLVRASWNVSSLTSRASMAKYLQARSNHVDWADLLEAFSLNVLRDERRGEPVVMVGRQPVTVGLRYAVAPIMPRDRATLLFAGGGTGKSTLAATLAASMALGQSLVPGWAVHDPGPVLVLDWEADWEEWNDRVAAVAYGAGFDAPELHYLAAKGSIVDMAERCAAVVAKEGIRLLVVDSMGMATPKRGQGGGAEEGATQVFSALRYIGCTSLLIDHVVKEDLDKDEGAGTPYGSVYKVNLARSAWELRLVQEEAEGAVRHVRMDHRKVNRGRLLQPIGLRLEYGETPSGSEVITTTLEAIPEDRDEPDSPEASTKSYRITQLLAQAGPMSATDLADAIGDKRRNVSALLAKLAAKGVVSKAGASQWRIVPDQDEVLR